MKRRKLLGDTAATATLLVGACIAIFPLAWILLTSFKNLRDAAAPPSQAFTFRPSIESYLEVLGNPSFILAGFTSLALTTISTVVVVAVSILGAYALARLRVRFRAVLVTLMVLLQVLPGMVLVVPLFRIVSALGMFDQWLPLIVILSGLNIPFATWMILAFIRSIPEEVEEAALIDGASRSQLLRLIVMPIAAPGIATAAIFTAITIWNAFLVPLVLGQNNAQTLTVFVSQFVTAQQVEWGPLCATSVLILGPIVLFVATTQRLLVNGLTAGSTK